VAGSHSTTDSFASRVASSNASRCSRGAPERRRSTASDSTVACKLKLASQCRGAVLPPRRSVDHTSSCEPRQSTSSAQPPSATERVKKAATPSLTALDGSSSWYAWL